MSKAKVKRRDFWKLFKKRILVKWAPIRESFEKIKIGKMWNLFRKWFHNSHFLEKIPAQGDCT